ncbi:MAG: hypothetical protein COU09_02125 [Candidatus Harrisonbacteria bacterium CG10_big_fil_rev_8_21_14_0_10_44_23]|uniref:Uncharacterized protein n=1 Tax=Candidatus Harrisonbacteria bacterium CG10_big_fil_rev_8_21_14_0_10_44_23 TaxID=1974585 RepID=A0A2H0UPZ6_9BACT|nr:MAG: hypothetical protein COU09_02125 [Candidatus Harrisonbacteria bacterium CG10_big_fil_rev_8_21_14_0_10_44_23]
MRECVLAGVAIVVVVLTLFLVGPKFLEENSSTEIQRIPVPPVGKMTFQPYEGLVATMPAGSEGYVEISALYEGDDGLYLPSTTLYWLSSRVPVEKEASIGKVLLRCEAAGFKPQEQRMLYFADWESVPALVKQRVRSRLVVPPNIDSDGWVALQVL